MQEAVRAVLPEAVTDRLRVQPCPDPKFGDYQTNSLMALAKERKMNPRQLATEVLGRLDVREWCQSVEIAGAGFLNFRLHPQAMGQAVSAALAGGPLFFAPAKSPRTIVVDFSSPNVAKPMHVGHIRSTVLGDSLVRIFRLLGHRVVTDNHIGDWGTQFGMLLVGWKTQLDRAALERDPISEMERLYRAVTAAGQGDPAVLERAREELVRLQNGDEENLGLWREMIALSQKQFDDLYARLGVKFDHVLGESFYNPQLSGVVADLVGRGIVRESEGAQVAFFEDIPELKDHPAIVQKKDGAANYATTDLATLQYRLATWNPEEIVYVTDGRQQLHFRQLFAIFRRWQPESKVKLAHVWFGSILGEDNKPFKTRSGETVKLAELLDEAQERAFQVVTAKNAELPEAQRREIARVVGLGAIKYSDLAQNRQSDYVFSWDKMLALQGNSAPYLQYVYTRVRSIFRKEAGSESTAGAGGKVSLAAKEELALARHLLNFGLALEAVAEEYRPNYLCTYLFELAGHFARFFENCPVLKAEGAEKASRLSLCLVTARVMEQGLNLLGIEVTEQM